MRLVHTVSNVNELSDLIVSATNNMDLITQYILKTKPKIGVLVKELPEDVLDKIPKQRNLHKEALVASTTSNPQEFFKNELIMKTPIKRALALNPNLNFNQELELMDLGAKTKDATIILNVLRRTKNLPELFIKSNPQGLDLISTRDTQDGINVVKNGLIKSKPESIEKLGEKLYVKNTKIPNTELLLKASLSLTNDIRREESAATIEFVLALSSLLPYVESGYQKIELPNYLKPELRKLSIGQMLLLLKAFNIVVTEEDVRKIKNNTENTRSYADTAPFQTIEELEEKILNKKLETPLFVWKTETVEVFVKKAAETFTSYQHIESLKGLLPDWHGSYKDLILACVKL